MFKLTHEGLKTRRWGPFRQEWYSICSAHRSHDPECPRCQSGRWINIYKAAGSSILYKVSPRLWRIWANRRNSGFNKWLKSSMGRKAFPNMKPRE